jgi:hypothetical protein
MTGGQGEVICLVCSACLVWEEDPVVFVLCLQYEAASIFCTFKLCLLSVSQGDRSFPLLWELQHKLSEQDLQDFMPRILGRSICPCLHPPVGADEVSGSYGGLVTVIDGKGCGLILCEWHSKGDDHSLSHCCSFGFSGTDLMGTFKVILSSFVCYLIDMWGTLKLKHFLMSIWALCSFLFGNRSLKLAQGNVVIVDMCQQTLFLQWWLVVLSSVCCVQFCGWEHEGWFVNRLCLLQGWEIGSHIPLLCWCLEGS